MAGSFVAPAVEDAARHPTWVLLDMNPYQNEYGMTCFDDGDNATTAYAVTSAGRTVKSAGGELISSAKDLVLFRSTSRQQPELYEYFVYQAACHRGNSLPTLKLIRTIHPGMSYLGILPSDDDDGEFFLADLSPTPDAGHYVLDVFSSKTDKWVTRPLQLRSPCLSVCTERVPPHKVMALGGGALCWVDLWQGILVCNVLDEHPALSFIPLPKPGIDLRRVGDLQMIRDVTCCDGIIKFVEMDCRFKEVCWRYDTDTESDANKTMYDDLNGEGIIYDSELLLEKGYPSSSMKYGMKPDGWKIRKCYRHLSWDYWRKDHVVDSNDVEIDNTLYSMVLPEPMDCDTQIWTLEDLSTVAYYPTLSARSCLFEVYEHLDGWC
ncbi:unnamed protein product [Alopecurus aequalis]